MHDPTIRVAEIKAIAALAAVLFLRMLPLFMLLPVLMLAADNYADATATLLGIALGIYGLTQALFQVPLGILSDKFGRKPIITFGLCLFITGCLIAAMSESVYGLIAGRAMQGCGAIAAAVMALASDLTSVSRRTKAMALLGISVGIAFSIAFIIAPPLYDNIHISGLFYLGAGMGLAAIIILHAFVPTTTKQQSSSKMITGKLKSTLTDIHLIRLSLSILISHTILTANFVVMPLTLSEMIGIAAASHWQFYLAVILVSLFITAPLVILSDRVMNTKYFLIASFILILISQTGLFFLEINIVTLCLFMIFFFGAFNFLEAFLPAQISKTVAADIKGTALGIYATFQFIGMFIGGITGGILLQKFGDASVHFFCLIIAACPCFFLANIKSMPNKET